MRRKLELLVDETLRPLVEADGGEITIVTVTEARIELRLSGACAGCPGLAYTRAEVIEPLLRELVGDEVTLEVHSRRLPKTA